MNTSKIIEGNVYEVKVGKNTTTMRVTKIERRVNGQIVFECMNTKTNKRATVSDAKRFIREIKAETAKPKATKTASEPKSESSKGEKSKGQMSGINAAYVVLKEFGEAMNIRQIMEQINERGLANLPGKTPSATVSAAIQRDIKTKGEASRFVKTDKGMFSAR